MTISQRILEDRSVYERLQQVLEFQLNNSLTEYYVSDNQLEVKALGKWQLNCNFENVIYPSEKTLSKLDNILEDFNSINNTEITYYIEENQWITFHE